MDLKELLETIVSYQNHFWSEPKDISIQEVLDGIRGDKHLQITQHLRDLYTQGNTEQYSEEKRKLPGVTFSASFEGRRESDHIKKYNSVIVLDIDKLGPQKLASTKAALRNDEFVFAFWESPSQNGLKGLVHIQSSEPEIAHDVHKFHKHAFSELADHFADTHDIQLDKSGSDIPRLCFISWDKDLVLKKEPISFRISEITDDQRNTARNKSFHKKSTNKRDLLNNPRGKNDSHNRKTITNIIKYLNRNSLSITWSYQEWYSVARAISKSFTFDVGWAYFLQLSRMDKKKFNENECHNLLINCYENNRDEISFGTIIHLAKEKGFKHKEKNAEST